MTSRQRTGLVFVLTSIWVSVCWDFTQFAIGAIGLIMLWDPKQVVEDLNVWQHYATEDLKAWLDDKRGVVDETRAHSSDSE